LEHEILPRKGYKDLIVTEKVHGAIRKRAMENDLTIREYVECLLTEDKATKEQKGKVA